MQNMQNQQLDEFGNPIQQQPVQAPNPMMPNRAGAPPRSMNNLVHQPLSTQGSMAYQKGKTPTEGGVGGVSNKISGDALREKIHADVERERNKFVGTGGNNSSEGPKKIPTGKLTFEDFPKKEKTPGFSNTKTLSDSTRKKMEQGNYDNENPPTSPFLKKEKWMQDLDIEKGGLHKSLGIPMNETIPYEDKVKASKSSNPKIKKQGILALNFLKAKRN